MKQILNEIFLEDCINAINKNYKEQLNISNEHYFIYSNIFQMTNYYKLLHFKKNPDYGMYDKIHNTKKYEVIMLMINSIKENNYNDKELLLLYSYICDLYLTSMIPDYVIHYIPLYKLLPKKRKMYRYSRTLKFIEAQYYQQRFYKNINKHPIPPKNFTIEEETLNLLERIYKEIYYNSYGIDVFKVSYNNFIKYQSNNKSIFSFIHKLSARIIDICSKTKLYSARSIYNMRPLPGKDYLNKENKRWDKNGIESIQSFSELLEEAVNKAANLIDIVSGIIFYNEKNESLIRKALLELEK